MYACDVLVVGGGFAGLNAVMAVKDAGANVGTADNWPDGGSERKPERKSAIRISSSFSAISISAA